MELKDYTTEELRAELKKRNDEEKAKKANKSVSTNAIYTAKCFVKIRRNE